MVTLATVPFRCCPAKFSKLKLLSSSSSFSTAIVVCFNLTSISLFVMAKTPATAGTSNDALLAAIKDLESKVDERITSMKRELTQEREQADERLVKRMKMEKAPTFKRKSHEVQYTFNEEVKAKFDSVKAALHETPPAVERAKFAIQEGEKLINDRQKLIRMADRSEHGWATVEEYEDDELADNSDDEKKLFEAEARAGRKLRQKLAKGKGKKTVYSRKPGSASWNKWQPAGSSFNQPSMTVGIDTPRHVPGASIASQGASQPSLSQLGPCFLCGNMGHFKKSCPLWAQLRAQSAKSGSN